METDGPNASKRHIGRRGTRLTSQPEFGQTIGRTLSPLPGQTVSRLNGRRRAVEDLQRFPARSLRLILCNKCPESQGTSRYAHPVSIGEVTGQ